MILFVRRSIDHLLYFHGSVTATATAAAPIPAAVDDVYTTTRLVKIRGEVVQLQISVWE